MNPKKVLAFTMLFFSLTEIDSDQRVPIGTLPNAAATHTATEVTI